MLINKTATPGIWVDGELTYTIRAVNDNTVVPSTNLVFRDTLDPALVALVPGSVQIDGNAVPDADVTYDEAGGELTVEVANIAAGEAINITFRVTQR